MAILDQVKMVKSLAQVSNSEIKKAWFEGGQMPLSPRLPRRGFNNPLKQEVVTVNLYY